MPITRLVVRFDRLPIEMRLGDSAMRQGFKRRKNVATDNARCLAAVIIGLNPRHYGRGMPDLMVGAAYRCPNKKAEGKEWCSWHADGPKNATILTVDRIPEGK